MLKDAYASAMQLKDVKQRGFVDWCGMSVFAGGWEASRKWSRDFLLFKYFVV